jgi:NAD(P)-dependent dehydrogenase (short-subunit alcohol dehydrogenase family)
MYSAAKAALLAYVRSNAADFAARNIRVNGIAPGTIDTDMVRNNTPEAQQVMADAALLKRAGHPDELVGMALFLASDASSFVTGATFHIDGGLVSR